ncbi:tripartite tricarboxylate transporter substrate binding protein [Paralcaligenes sp. KSB-10]|uniref:Bug family tripartite tricarboxylate transporter substrate binding protein n=1 Tax=Paralcaligenes sp. KSB-10 TaxID=2901142 RepID=UPI001E504CA8|nr:tripartite tricarboxylate transporter substrate binding protein [Paralcaligenes sp. KSB-10]UHL63210.1 tripartite tricarboxylate transporter substrate binding protein [Paralcaligenes sp. KSB-10]
MQTSLKKQLRRGAISAGLMTSLFVSAHSYAADAWKPTKNIQVIVAAGAGGGTDQLARLIQSIITRHKLMDVSTVVVNKGGGNGAEGFLDIKMAKGDPYKIIVGTNNAYLLPLVAKLGYQWTDLTPVAMVAQDDFILWGPENSPFKTVKDYINAVKATPAKYPMGGSQSKDVDQTLTMLINKTEGTKFVYIPFKSGGEASTQLAGGHIASNTNNPSESISQWRAHQVKPWCVFSKERMVYTKKITDTQAWSDVPTCVSQGIHIDEFRFPRTVFMPGGVTDAQRQYYVDLLKKVTETPEFKEYLERGALVPSFLAGKQFNDYIQADDKRAREIFKEAGWLKQ